MWTYKYWIMKSVHSSIKQLRKIGVLVTNSYHRMYRINIAERAIQTFKTHFMEILAGIDPDLPKYIWGNLLVQTEVTINLLRQATLNPRMSAWEYYNGAFDYTATPS